MKGIIEFISPVSKYDSPAWLYRTGRSILSLALLLLPLLYDRQVPEVAGDIRWHGLHLTTGLLSTLTLATYAFTQNATKRRIPPVVWVVALFALWTVCSYFWTFDKLSGWFELKNQIAYFALFALVLYFRNVQWYMSLLWIMSIPLSINAVLAIMQFHGVNDDFMRSLLPLPEGRMIDYFHSVAPPAGTLSNKNLLGSYLVMMLPVALALTLLAKTTKKRAAAAVILTLSMIAFVYTRSRASWVAAAVAVLLFAVWMAVDKLGRTLVSACLNKHVISMLAGAMAVTVLAAQFQSPLRGYHSVGESIASRMGTIVDMGKTGNLGTRAAYYKNSMHMILDRPVTGHGIGSFFAIYPRYHNASVPTPKAGYSLDARPRRAHNDFLETLVELGVTGGVLLTVIFMLLMHMIWGITRQQDIDSQVRLCIVGIAVGIIALGVNLQGDFPMRMPTAPIIFWAFAGILAGHYTLFIMPEAKAGILSNSLSKRTVIAPMRSWEIFEVLAVLSGAYTLYVEKDNVKLRNANRYLKHAMHYVHTDGRYDELVLRAVEEAYRRYPLDQRVQEYRAVIYAKYEGNSTIGWDSRIEAIEEALRYDPHSPNNLLNLSGAYMFKMAELMSMGGSQKKALEIYRRGIDTAQRFIRVAEFAPEGFTVQGYLQLYRGDLRSAVSNFNRSLERDPSYTPAIEGLKQAKAGMKVTVGARSLDRRMITGE